MTTNDDRTLLDAAYAPSSDSEWLTTLAHGATDLLEARAGSYAYTYRIAPDGTITLGGVGACEADEDYWRTLFQWGAANTHTIARLYRTQVMTLDGAFERAHALELPLTDPSTELRRHRVRDMLVVMGQSHDNAGLILAAPARNALSLSPARRARLERIAAELTLAQRLRRLRATPPLTLSPREHQVAALLRRGLSDKQIAHALGVTLSSVAEYTQRLRRKHHFQPGEELLALAPVLPCAGYRRTLAERLTPAEHTVACLLIAGASHAAIARERNTTPRTIASQLAAVFRKAGVSGRRQLVACWFGEATS